MTRKTAVAEIAALSRRIEELTRLIHEASKSGGLAYLVVRADERSVLMPTSAIDWIEANGDYVRIHRGRGSSQVRKSMRELEAALDPKRFVRVHRSAIVNVDRIREFQRMFHGEYKIVLNSGVHLTLSRNYRQNLQKLLGDTL